MCFLTVHGFKGPGTRQSKVFSLLSQRFDSSDKRLTQRALHLKIFSYLLYISVYRITDLVSFALNTKRLDPYTKTH